LKEPAVQNAQGNQQADTRDGGLVHGDYPASVHRNRKAMNSLFLEAHLIASQESHVKFAYAAGDQGVGQFAPQLTSELNASN
jgi:hypothetical protein